MAVSGFVTGGKGFFTVAIVGLQCAEFPHSHCESQQKIRAMQTTNSHFVQVHFQPDARFSSAMLLEISHLQHRLPTV